jgi:hypothetical protein
VRGQRPVGAIDVGVGAAVDDDRELGGRDDPRGDPAQQRDLGRGRHEDGGLAFLLREQLRGVHPARRTGCGDAPGLQAGPQFPERAVVPGREVAGDDHPGDGGGHRGGNPAVRDGGDVARVGEQVPQRRDGALGPGQVLLQARQVRGYEPVAGPQVRSREDRADLLQGHVEVPEAADDLRGRDLIGRVAPVPGGRVDVRRLQEAEAVIVPQRLDAQLRGAGEIPDAQRGGHTPSVDPPLRGESTPAPALDPPVMAAARVDLAGRGGRQLTRRPS